MAASSKILSPCPVILAVTQLDSKLERADVDKILNEARTEAKRQNKDQYNPNTTAGDEHKRTALMIALDNKNNRAVKNILDNDTAYEIDFTQTSAPRPINTLDHLADSLPSKEKTLSWQEMWVLRAVSLHCANTKNLHMDISRLLKKALQHGHFSAADYLLKNKKLSCNTNKHDFVYYWLMAFKQNKFSNDYWSKEYSYFNQHRRLIWILSHLKEKNKTLSKESFRIAIEIGDSRLMALLLNYFEHSINTLIDGESPIEIAMRLNQPTIVNLLVERKAKITAQALQTFYKTHRGEPDKKEEYSSVSQTLIEMKDASNLTGAQVNQILDDAFYKSMPKGQYNVNDQAEQEDKKTHLMIAIDNLNIKALSWFFEYVPFRDGIVNCSDTKDAKNQSALDRIISFENVTPVQNQLLRYFVDVYIRYFNSLGVDANHASQWLTINKSYAPFILRRLVKPVIRNGLSDQLRRLSHLPSSLALTIGWEDQTADLIKDTLWALENKKIEYSGIEPILQRIDTEKRLGFKQSSFYRYEATPQPHEILSAIKVGNEALLRFFVEKYRDKRETLVKLFEESLRQKKFDSALTLMTITIDEKPVELINKPRSLFFENGNYSPVLNEFGKAGNIDAVKFLIEQKADCAFESKDYSVLHAAATSANGSSNESRRCVTFLTALQTIKTSNMSVNEYRTLSETVHPDDLPLLDTHFKAKHPELVKFFSGELHIKPSVPLQEQQIEGEPNKSLQPDFKPSVPLIIADPVEGQPNSQPIKLKISNEEVAAHQVEGQPDSPPAEVKPSIPPVTRINPEEEEPGSLQHDMPLTPVSKSPSALFTPRSSIQNSSLEDKISVLEELSKVLEEADLRKCWEHPHENNFAYAIRQFVYGKRIELAQRNLHINQESADEKRNSH